MNTILLFILIIANIISITISVIILMILKKQYYKSSNKKVDFNIDEYLGSLEFNMLLDKNITPLLGKVSNDEIVNIVSQCVIKEDKRASEIDKNTLNNYIRDILLNYHNSYSKNIDNTIIEDIDKIVIPTSKSNTIDISNTISNFYDN